MAKKGLKKALENHQAMEKAAQPTKKASKKAKSVSPEPEVAVEEPSLEVEEQEEVVDIDLAPLSKKEKRRLKKELKKQQEEQAKAEENQDSEAEDDEEEEEDEDEDEEEARLDLEKLAQSDDDDDEDDEEDDEDDDEDKEDDNEEEEEEDPEADIPLSDVEFDDDADIVPHQKLTVNNTAALRELLARIELPWAKHSFVEHQLVVSPDKVEAGIKDIYDDTERELAFYKQGLDAVKQARATLLKLNVPFSRPLDYFAEMVKLDEHMEKLKQKLLTEAANKKASEEAKKQRHLKKFGKQVQHATLQERAKQKKEALGKIDQLKKRKRGTNEMLGDDEFDIALEDAVAGKTYEGPNKRAKVNGKRKAKDAKFGFGGKKRFLRKNDAQLSMDVSGFSNHKKQKRPGKSRRRH
ncbi:hypothetical protein JNB11_06255 [Kocuria palustris]|nr:hypothetical protein [Kocuria palustris]